jgi:3-methyladenine DNA glycosylase AlkD
LEEIEKLLLSKIHEYRLTALLILGMRFRRGNSMTKGKIARFYIKNVRMINNWDLVDASAPYILGGYLEKRDRNLLYVFAKSDFIWKRRIAIVSTYHFIRKGEFIDTLAISELLLEDTHDLIHKAVGWMLREVGKKDEKVLKRFLDTYAGTMPRTTLRYAIERLTPAEKKHYMNI